MVDSRDIERRGMADIRNGSSNLQCLWTDRGQVSLHKVEILIERLGRKLKIARKQRCRTSSACSLKL